MPKHLVPPEGRSFAKRLRKQQTDVETLLWHELRGKRIGGWKFKRQVPIDGYVADFVCFEARLIVEIDGPLHREPEQAKKDQRRDVVLRGHGLRILRFSTEAPLAAMVRDITKALGEKV